MSTGSILHPLYPKLAIQNGTVVAHQELTVSTAAVPFGTAFNTLTNVVSFDIQDNDVRVRFDATDPTSTKGHILPAGTAYSWDMTQAAAARFIRVSTASADAKIFLSEYSA